MAQFKIFRETSLPAVLEAYAVYLVAPASKPNYVEMYVSDSTGSTAKRILTDTDIQSMITAAMASANQVQVVANIAARNALTPVGSWHFYVQDASDDPTVDAGGAGYLWDTTNEVWVKLYEAESLDIQLDWDGLQGKPSSSVADIDDAVAKAHTHTNKSTLDKLGEDGDGLTFAGAPVTSQWASTEW